MKITVSKNGRLRTVAPTLGEKRAPLVVVAYGTQMNLVLRYLWHWLGELLTKVCLRSIDTTAQRDHIEVPHLPDHMFLNLAEIPGLQQRLRAARDNPRISEWITPGVTRMNPGPGAGAEPLLARFEFEDAWQQVLAFFQATIGSLVGPRRAESAARHRLGWAGNSFSFHDPVQVFHLFGISGASGSLAELGRLGLEDCFSRAGGEAVYHAVLTLPSVTGADSVSREKRLKLTYARLQELADSSVGRGYEYQPTDDVTIVVNGPLYDTVCLMPEPKDGDQLDKHARYVASYLHQMLEPLGKAAIDTFVDKTSLIHELGPLGQKRFLSRVGMATLRAVPFDILPFTEIVLGLHATRSIPSDANEAADDFCRRQGLTTSQLFQTLPVLQVPDSTKIAEKDHDVFLRNLERNLAKQKAENLRIAKACYETHMHTAEQEFLVSVEKMARKKGPEAVENYAFDISGRLEELRAAYSEHRATHIPNGHPDGNLFEERVYAVHAREEMLSKQSFSSIAIKAIDPLVEQVNVTRQDAGRKATVVAETRRQYEIAWRQLPRPAEHSVLTTDMLKTHIEREAASCATEVRAACWELLDAKRCRREIGVIVDKNAQPFLPLAQLEEAFRIVDEPPEEVLQRTLAAAEPSVRIDPIWNIKNNASRLLFTTMPSGHSLMPQVRRSGREIKYAASSSADTEWQFLTADCGIEVGALQATHEAYAAFLSNPDPEFPPFLDRKYKPLTRLYVPPRREWFAVLAFAIHRVLAKGVITHTPQGLFFDGVYLGETYVEASKNLAKQTNRDPHLPSFKEISDRTESLLVGDRPIQRVLEILRDIEVRLGKQLARLEDCTDPDSAKKRLVHDEELAITERLIDRYSKFADDHDADKEIWDSEGPYDD